MIWEQGQQRDQEKTARQVGTSRGFRPFNPLSVHLAETMLRRLNVKRSLTFGKQPRNATLPQEGNDETIRREC